LLYFFRTAAQQKKNHFPVMPSGGMPIEPLMGYRIACNDHLSRTGTKGICSCMLLTLSRQQVRAIWNIMCNERSGLFLLGMWDFNCVS
jgi:hypothetical protein